MNPDTLTTLSRAFDRLDLILPDARNFLLSDTGITFSFSRPVGCRGYFEDESEVITLTWGEFLDEEGVYPHLETICRAYWDAARKERTKAEKLAEEERKKKQALELAEFNRLAPIRKKEKELEELRKLMAAYPAEASAALPTNLPTTTS